MANFVKLTRVDANGGGTVWINVDRVFSIAPGRSGTHVKFGKNGEAVDVRETPHEILARGAEPDVRLRLGKVLVLDQKSDDLGSSVSATFAELRFEIFDRRKP